MSVGVSVSLKAKESKVKTAKPTSAEDKPKAPKKEKKGKETAIDQAHALEPTSDANSNDALKDAVKSLPDITTNGEASSKPQSKSKRKSGSSSAEPKVKKSKTDESKSVKEGKTSKKRA